LAAVGTPNHPKIRVVSISRIRDRPGRTQRISIAGTEANVLLNPRKDPTMQNLTKFVSDFITREDGPTAVEYAVMLALIVVVCIGAITTLGSNAKATFTGVGTAIQGASS
jgi:pilus assembly protein Flp/PilA